MHLVYSEKSIIENIAINKSYHYNLTPFVPKISQTVSDEFKLEFNTAILVK
jgi:hypothetical protein